MAIALGKKIEAAQPTKALLSDNNFWYTWIIPPLALSIITFLFYFPSLHYPFQFDDLANIVKFYDIRHKTLHDLFLSNSRWISYWLNTIYFKIARFDPFYYRLGNVCFHTLSGIILFYVLLISFKNVKKESFFKTYAVFISFVAAGLFMLHPVQTQTVSYVIQGQLEGLSGLFVLSMCLCLLILSQTSSKLIYYSTIFLMFLLAFFACGTKEIAIVAPILLLLLDWFFIAQGEISALKQRWWLHAGISFIIFGGYLFFLKPAYFKNVFGFSIEMRNNVGNMLTQSVYDKITPYNYCISEFKVILHYIGIFFWPFNISVDYDWQLSKSFFAPDSLFPFLILLGIAYLVLKRWHRNKTDIVCWAILWWFILLLPRSSIIPSTEFMVDYKTYLASVGIHVLLASCTVFIAVWLVKKYSLAAQWFFVFLLTPLLFAGYLTYERNKVWRTAVEFWSNIVLNAPKKARSHNNYGTALSEAGKTHEAIESFKRAIKLDPFYPDPLNNIAVSYGALGQVDNAIAAIQKSIKIQPYYPEGYNNLANFLIQKKEYEKAEAALKQAIKLRPHYGKALFNLGRIYMLTNKLEESYEAYKNCCTKGDFDNEMGFLAYGMMSLKLQRIDEAITALNKALSFNPKSIDVAVNLVDAYMLAKDYDKALQAAQYAFSLKADARMAFNIGEMLCNKQQFGQALPWFEKALQLHTTAEVVHLRIAGCLEKLGRFDEAQVMVQQFIATNPEQHLLQTAQHALKMMHKKKMTAERGRKPLPAVN